MHPQKTLALTFLDISAANRFLPVDTPATVTISRVSWEYMTDGAAGFTGPRTEILGARAVQRTSYGWKM
jgi:hypothetical protein